MERRADLKAEVVRRGRRLTMVAVYFGWSYNHLIRVMNGFNHPPGDFEIRFRRMLAGWDEHDLTVRKQAARQGAVGDGRQDRGQQ